MSFGRRRKKAGARVFRRQQSEGKGNREKRASSSMAWGEVRAELVVSVVVLVVVVNGGGFTTPSTHPPHPPHPPSAPVQGPKFSQTYYVFAFSFFALLGVRGRMDTVGSRFEGEEHDG